MTLLLVGHREGIRRRRPVLVRVFDIRHWRLLGRHVAGRRRTAIGRARRRSVVSSC